MRNAKFQTPGCNGPNKNGIKLYNFIEMPIHQDKIVNDWLEGWDEVVFNIRRQHETTFEERVHEVVMRSKEEEIAVTDRKSIALRLTDNESVEIDDAFVGQRAHRAN